MKKFNFFLIFLSAMCFNTLKAQKLIIHQKDGSTTNGVLAGSKITFSGSNFTFATTTSSTQFAMSDVSKITFDNSSSINQSSSSSNLSVYPNPAKDFIQISGISTQTLVQIYRIDGVLVFSQSVESGAPIEVTSFSSGVYIVKANGQTSKFIKK